MPELPEVETIKLGLERRIKGLKIKDVAVRMSGMFLGKKEDVIDAEVKGIKRRAKILIIDLVNDKSILIHLKMTGQLVFQSPDEKVKVVGGHPQAEYNRPLPHAHTHVIITFKDGSHLYFNDLRRFGWMKVVLTNEVEEEPGIGSAGPEPFGEGYALDWFKEALKRRKKSLIKPVIMDQSFIAGIGNIYSDEALYYAGILPDRRVGSLSEQETMRLFDEIPRVLELALHRGGASDSTYIGVDGERGDYLKTAAVYHKLKDPKGHAVLRKKIGGRTAHFCTICQC